MTAELRDALNLLSANSYDQNAAGWQKPDRSTRAKNESQANQALARSKPGSEAAILNIEHRTFNHTRSNFWLPGFEWVRQDEPKFRKPCISEKKSPW
jgi:hypothetical protein